MPAGVENNTQSDRRADLDRVAEAARKAREYLLGLQNEEGYWVGELEADASVAAGYLPLMLFMTGKVNEPRVRKIVHYVLSRQKPDGSWSTHEGGPGDLSVSVQVYFALKLAGKAETEPEMHRTRSLFSPREACSAPTSSPKSGWLFLDNMSGATFPRCRPSLFCCPTGSISISMSFRAGRGPPWWR